MISAKELDELLKVCSAHRVTCFEIEGVKVSMQCKPFSPSPVGRSLAKNAPPTNAAADQRETY